MVAVQLTHADIRGPCDVAGTLTVQGTDVTAALADVTSHVDDLIETVGSVVNDLVGTRQEGVTGTLFDGNLSTFEAGGIRLQNQLISGRTTTGIPADVYFDSGINVMPPSSGIRYADLMDVRVQTSAAQGKSVIKGTNYPLQLGSSPDPISELKVNAITLDGTDLATTLAALSTRLTAAGF